MTIAIVCAVLLCCVCMCLRAAACWLALVRFFCSIFVVAPLVRYFCSIFVVGSHKSASRVFIDLKCVLAKRVLGQTKSGDDDRCNYMRCFVLFCMHALVCLPTCGFALVRFLWSIFVVILHGPSSPEFC